MTDKVKKAAQRGYLKGLDGRKLFVRSEHSALNTLLQGGGAIVMKQAMDILYNLIKLNTFDAKFVANIHDEWQIQVRETQVEAVGTVGVQSIHKAGDHFNLRCPLDGEFKVGESWYETH